MGALQAGAGRSTQYPLNRRLCGTHSQSEQFGAEKNLLPAQGIKPAGGQSLYQLYHPHRKYSCSNTKCADLCTEVSQDSSCFPHSKFSGQPQPVFTHCSWLWKSIIFSLSHIHMQCNLLVHVQCNTFSVVYLA